MQRVKTKRLNNGHGAEPLTNIHWQTHPTEEWKLHPLRQLHDIKAGGRTPRKHADSV